MDASLKQILSSFELGLTSYKEKLGESNEKVKKALALYGRLNDLAEQAKDMMDFYAKPDGQNAMNELSGLMQELAKEKPVQGVRTVPASSQVAAGYHMAYDSMQTKDPATEKVYRRVFELEKTQGTAPEFLASMAEEGLFLAMSTAPILAQQPALLENADINSLPVMVNFHERTTMNTKAARSTAELEYHANLEAEISIYQNLWDTGFLNATELLLGNAISSWLMSPTEEHREEVENSYRFVAEFFGVDYDGLMAVPRIKDYIVKIVFKSVKKDMAAKGVDTPDLLIQGFKSALEACIQGKEPVKIGPASNSNLQLWGTSTPMTDLEQAYRTTIYK